MKLKKLLKEIPFTQFKGSKDIEINGICSHSKLVSPGNLFIARRGKLEDGSQYIPEAVSAGAVAILTDIYDPSLKQIAQIIHHDVASVEGILSAVYYQFPSDELFMVGITGTNGKTTTSFLVKHLLDQWEGPCGLIGTIEYIIGKHRYQAIRTTPDVTTNHKMLREMVLQGCRSAVMEVTSHALDQRRVQNIDFNVAIYTNLSLDHLDYHHTMENYYRTKNQLFRTLDTSRKKKIPVSPKLAVINRDCPWHHKILEGTQAPILTYGILSNADIRATEIQLFDTKTCFKVTYRDQTLPFCGSLIGRFNVYNTLAAIGVGIAREIPLERILEILESPPAVKGRLQPVQNALNLKIYIDFAHSDDALVNVLECLRELRKGRIITVFGCGGDRDSSKRPKMGQVAEELSDFCIVTSDNPRSEDPAEIAKQVLKGFKNSKNYLLELDRRKAIATAIDMATSDDIILIAGKGHETYQVFAHKTVEFDDAKVAMQLCKEKKK